MSDTIPSPQPQSPPFFPPTSGRCQAAHADDPSQCDGQFNAVQVVDQFGRHSNGCSWHGLLLYASLTNAVIYPITEEPAAVDALRRISRRLRELYGRYWDHDPDNTTTPSP